MKERDSKFELLRIFAMLMIIGSHLACHGIMHVSDEEGSYILWSEGSLIDKLFSTALTMGGSIGVALFFMITGYFMINNDKIKLEKVACETFYYGIFAVGVFCVSYFLCGYLYPEITATSLLSGALKVIFIPLTGGHWWFITAYVFIILLHPIINRLMARLNKKGSLLLLFIAWVFWYSFGNALNATFFPIQRGAFFYLIGGYIRKYDVIEKAKDKKKFLIFAGIAALVLYTAVAYIGNLQNIDTTLTLTKKLINKFISSFNVAVPIPIEATVLFLMFGNMNIKSNEAINKIAATTFGVYLIHDSAYGRSLIWRGILKVDIFWYKLPVFPLAALCLIIVVFAVCSAIDLLRIKFVEPKMFKIVDKIKMQISNKLCSSYETE